MISTEDFRITTQKSYPEIFSPELKEFLVQLHQKFNSARKRLLIARAMKQVDFDHHQMPSFFPDTEHIRTSDWVCAPLPADLLDRRVEITGPVERKMIINALNSGASTFMADFEDSNSPTWENCMNGQINLSDAVTGTISFLNESGKAYRLNERTAVLQVRPRGLHLEEKHILINGDQASASLIDFGIYFFRNAQKLIEKGSAPYFYLPKLEHYREARWWNEVFLFSQQYLNIPNGTIKATVLIETITASFQLHEILYELREHSAGLNCGRWDYIFSYIKKFRNLPEFMVPDRDQVTMESPFMAAYSKSVIQTCHRRNVHAIGGMAAHIPVKDNVEENEAAFKKIKADKEREVKNGHDGTWVAHPGLVAIAKDIFDAYMQQPNQITKKFPEYQITAEDLLEVPQGKVTEAGVRKNINVGILYIESWLMGVGAAAIYNLMEDAATAEISRSQLWQWLKNDVKLDDGQRLLPGLILQWQEEELQKIRQYIGDERFENGKFALATEIFSDLVLNDHFAEFLTLETYKYL